MLPSQQRVKFILFAFFGFLITITIFFVVAIYYLLLGPELAQRAQADLLTIELRQKYDVAQQQAGKITSERDKIRKVCKPPRGPLRTSRP
jgi:hypothetical protein